jgi:hypothetical protein
MICILTTRIDGEHQIVELRSGSEHLDGQANVARDPANKELRKLVAVHKSGVLTALRTAAEERETQLVASIENSK